MIAIVFRKSRPQARCELFELGKACVVLDGGLVVDGELVSSAWVLQRTIFDDTKDSDEFLICLKTSNRPWIHRTFLEV